MKSELARGEFPKAEFAVKVAEEKSKLAYLEIILVIMTSYPRETLIPYYWH